MTPPLSIGDLSRRDPAPLRQTDAGALAPLPAGFLGSQPAAKPLNASNVPQLDGTRALSLPEPRTAEEEAQLVAQFLSGIDKLFTEANNWTFLQPLLLTIEQCARCQSCSEACHIFEASGREELYRPTFRTEVLRRVYYARKGGLLSAWRHGRIEINWPMIARLAELAYRCNLCRRCAQACPIGADNALVAHELRKVFSQEMGIAPRELHERGSMTQLKIGSSTGMSPIVVRDNIDFIDEDTAERTGLDARTPWDVEGADILLIHNAGEILAWPENVGAFAAILNAAGVSWTMSSEIAGYDSINYGLWYDDAQFARVALKHAEIARKLKVKRIVIGECGHAHKALGVVADRLLTGDGRIPRESSLTLLRDIVRSGRLKLDASRNDFPVTLHDPCNLVRLMGVVEPQREILRQIAPRFREMAPHGVDNYCCGGGSGFAIMAPNNFADWRFNIAGRKKLEQVLGAFDDCLAPETPKYLCAPCSNCKGQFRDMFAHYGIWKSHRIQYGGLVELIVNAMADARPGYLEWEWH